jgi:hypothetical protein
MRLPPDLNIFVEPSIAQKNRRYYQEKIYGAGEE